MVNLNNEQMLRNLLKDLNSLEACILRERIVKIMEQTQDAIERNPKSWERQLIAPGHYLTTAEKVQKHLGFDK